MRFDLACGRAVAWQEFDFLSVGKNDRQPREESRPLEKPGQEYCISPADFITFLILC